MNCHHARQLISPYLDGQLTGQEMLALGDHLAGCESCQDEISSLRQIKSLLRGLHAPAPRLEFTRQLSSQEILSQSAAWKPPSSELRPQRGRRLMSALALSCLTLLVLAPASRESRDTASGVPVMLPHVFPASSQMTAGTSVPAPLTMAGSSGYQFGNPPRRGLIIFTRDDISGPAFPYMSSYKETSYEMPLTAFPSSTVTLTSHRPR